MSMIILILGSSFLLPQVLFSSSISGDDIIMISIIEPVRENLEPLLEAGYDIMGFRGSEVHIITSRSNLKQLEYLGYSPKLVDGFPFKVTEDYSSFAGAC